MRKILLLALLVGCVVPVTATETFATNEILYGAIRWDAWSGDSTLHPQSFFDENPQREPLQGWASDTQSYMDWEINVAADAGLDYWAFAAYPTIAQYPNAPVVTADIDGLSRSLNLYLSSEYKDRIRFALILQTGWVAGGGPLQTDWLEFYWESVTVPHLVGLFNDPQYVKIGDRPVLFWYVAHKIGEQTAGFGEDWPAKLQFLIDQTVLSGLGEPYFVEQQGSEAVATTYGFDALSNYGFLHQSSGMAFEDHAALDRSAWNASTMPTIPILTATYDSRPLGTTYWTGPPTYSQWTRHLQDAEAWLLAHPNNPQMLLIYSWNELAEGGRIIPTQEFGTMFLDGIRAVKSGLSENKAQLTFTSSSVYSTMYPFKAFDGNNNSPWQADPKQGFGGQWIAVEFPSPRTIGAAHMREYGDRTTSFRIEYLNGSWQTAYDGTVIGEDKVVYFLPVTASKFRLYFVSGTYSPIVYTFGLH